MNKSDLRRMYIEKRKIIVGKEDKSHEIFMNVTALACLKSVKTIAVYSALPDEAGTSELIDFLLYSGKEVYLPKVLGDNMEFYRISSLSDIKIKGSYGISEPEADNINKLEKERLDAVIMPGVCFDESGSRIGFGKGYYDRYLAGMDGVIKIALCFEEQILKDGLIAADSHDVRADIIVTDKKVRY